MSRANFNPGANYTLSTGRDGSSIDIIPTFRGFAHPFKIRALKSGGSIKVTVRAGTVNNIVPKIGSTYLDDAETPELTISGDNTHRIYLQAATGSSPAFFPNTCEVLSFTNDQTDTDEEGNLLIGTVVVEGGSVKTINQYVFSSQVVARAKPGSATAIWLWSSR